MPPSTSRAQVETARSWRALLDLGATWLLRLLLFATGPTVAGAISTWTDGASDPVRIVAATLWWSAWGLAILGVVVPGALGLTAVRIVAPVGVSVAVVSALATTAHIAALVCSVGAALVAFTWRLGEEFVDQSSYGPEERLLLKPPGYVWLGPLPLAWIVVVAGVATGPLLLAARSWVWGGVATMLGLPAAWIAAGALHRLSTRWMVLVPGGVVLHDRLATLDPVLFRRDLLASVGPAFEGTAAHDLTQSALGTPIELGFRGPIEMIPIAARSSALSVERFESVLVAPTRPGRFVKRLDEHLRG